MAYPDKAELDYSYEGFQQGQGDNSFPGTAVDNDLANLKASIDETIDFLSGAFRSDGILNENSLPGGDVLDEYIAQTAADVVLTHADVVFTHADVVLTHADVVLTHADVILAAASAASAAASVAALSATSVSSLAIATGAKTFVTQAGKLFVAGQYLQIASNASALNFMHGTVTSYSGTSLVMNVTDIGGSGTLADWNISLSGTQGPQGIQGIQGPATVADLTVRAATTANGTLATAFANGQTIDAIVLVTGNLILLKNQSAPAENGVYVVAASGAPARDDNYDTYNEHPGAVISVQEGTTNADTIWMCTSNAGGTLNVTAIAFTQVNAAASDTVAGIVELATSAETVTGSDTVRAVTPAGLAAAARKQGRETIYIPAAAMQPRITNGPAHGAVEMTTNKNILRSLDFDTTTQEFAQFEIPLPKSWDLGTVTFRPRWSHAATTVNFGVAWGLAGIAISDNEAGDVAFGTAVTSVDTGGTTNQRYTGPESAAITIAGTPAAADMIQFQLNRTVADAGDTMAIDARLHGIELFFITNAPTDA